MTKLLKTQLKLTAKQFFIRRECYEKIIKSNLNYLKDIFGKEVVDCLQTNSLHPEETAELNN